MKHFVLLLIISFTLCGCFTLTTMQTGRTLGEGNSETVFGGSYSINPPHFSDTNMDKFRNVPVFSIRCPFGMTRNFDLGATLDHTTFLGISAKYQVAGDKNSLFACSLGANVGINLVFLRFGEIQSFFSFPLYLSYHPRSNFSFYMSPRYDYLPSGDLRSRADNGLNPFSTMNITYGFMLGVKHKVALEMTHTSENTYKPAQISVGYILPFDLFER